MIQGRFFPRWLPALWDYFTSKHAWVFSGTCDLQRVSLFFLGHFLNA